jgi:Alpha-glutamyl/putrescinyl thymine pyrophosphorylase clade 2
MPDVKAPVSDHPPSWHVDRLAEFTQAKLLIGEPSPHLKLVVELSKDLTWEEKVWRAGCYAVPYSLTTAEAIWQIWPHDRVASEGVMELDEWIHVEWAGMHTRTERRCVRSANKFAESLISYWYWMHDQLPEVIAIANTQGNPKYQYEMFWESAARLYQFGRYINIRLLELLRRSVGIPATLPDIRGIGGWSPLRALTLFFPEETKPLLRGHAPTAEILATRLLEELQGRRIPVDHYVLAAMLCEYREAYEDRHQYPGRTHDQEIEYLNGGTGAYWAVRGIKSEIVAARRRIFPSQVLGERQGWSGVRHDLSRVLRDQEYVWQDLVWDYVASKDDLVAPVLR